MRAHDRFLAVNGLQIRYREWGGPSSPSLILLHGGSAHAHWWDVFAAAVADTYHVFAVDLRGHGDSQHARPPAYRIADYSGDLATFVEAQRLTRFHLVGHSLGAMVAAAYAGSAPQRLASLSVVDSLLKITDAGARYMTRLQRFPQPMYRTRELAIERFRLLPIHTRATPEILAHVAAHGIRQLADGQWTLKFDRAALAMTEAQDLSVQLQPLRCPILLVRGALSTLVPRKDFASLRSAAPHAVAVEIGDAHHHVMLDNPGAFEHAMRRFLRSAQQSEGGNGASRGDEPVA